MKKWIVLALALLLGVMGVVARAETGALDVYVQEGWTVESVSRCGASVAAVLCRAGERTERVLYLSHGAQITVCPQAVNTYHRGAFSLLLDTDDMLFISFCEENGCVDQLDCCYLDGQWRLTAVSCFTETEWDHVSQEGASVVLEKRAALADGQLLRAKYVSDENDNLLAAKELPPLPNVRDESELLMENVQFDDLPIHTNGYNLWLYGAEEEALVGRLFEKIVANGSTYVSGRVFEDTLQFLADRPDGARVLLCGSYDGAAQSWQFVESAPLPAGTTLGVENFVDSLALGGSYNAVNVGRFANGKWGVTYYMGYTNGGDMFCFGQNVVSEGGYYWNAGPVVGDHPWNDITRIDWDSLPSTLKEARQTVNPARWATPNNANPEDRLNLRERPDKSSGSLGKFYNGTPVEVLERGKEWTRVRIGAREGYMMTRYLAFGRDMARVEPHLFGQQSRYALCAVRWDGSQGEEYIFPDEDTLHLLIVGQADNTWYIVWDAELNRFGRIRQADLWEGNG